MVLDIRVFVSILDPIHSELQWSNVGFPFVFGFSRFPLIKSDMGVHDLTQHVFLLYKPPPLPWAKGAKNPIPVR